MRSSGSKMTKPCGIASIASIRRWRASRAARSLLLISVTSVRMPTTPPSCVRYSVIRTERPSGRSTTYGAGGSRCARRRSRTHSSGIVADRHGAAPDAGAQQILEPDAGLEQLGREGILVAIARIEHDQPVGLVPQDEPFGHRFDRRHQLPARAHRLVARGDQRRLGALDGGDVGQRHHQPAIGQQVAVELQPYAVGQLALGARLGAAVQQAPAAPGRALRDRRRHSRRAARADEARRSTWFRQASARRPAGRDIRYSARWRSAGPCPRRRPRCLDRHGRWRLQGPAERRCRADCPPWCVLSRIAARRRPLVRVRLTGAAAAR